MRKIVVGLSVSALVVGCGGSGSPRRVNSSVPQAAPPPAPTALQARVRPRSCVRSPGFGGLGGNANSFAPNNNGTVGRAGPTPGTAWYELLATRKGCVFAYSVQDSATPPLKTRQMLDLVSRTYLPEDAERVATGTSCVVWKSRMLKAAVGAAYAKAIAASQHLTIPGVALIEASQDSNCRSSG